jgi:hypothetical protein
LYEECELSLSYLIIGPGVVTFSSEANNLLVKNPTQCPILPEEILNKYLNDLEWLSGFAEAESVFSVSKTGTLTFRIKLHYDDRETLVYIKNLLSKLAERELGVIVDSKDQHESYYSVSKFQDIVGVIIPIFSLYYFTTSKYFDFRDFKTAAEIKMVSFLEKRKLNDTELEKILAIKSGMNASRKGRQAKNKWPAAIDPKSLPKRTLTPYRLLGFVEGDGTFSLPNLLPYFGIKQHSKNIHFFYEIAEFLSNLPYNPVIGPTSDVLNTKPKATVHISPTNNLASLSVSNILQLYNYILPFFKSLEFKSRKAVDFEF